MRRIVLALGCALAAGGALAGEIVLDAKALYNGFEARRAVLSEDGAKVVLDKRAFTHGKKDKTGRIQTDPVPLVGNNDGIEFALKVHSVAVELASDAPEGSSVKLECRTGDRYFTYDGWSGWEEVAGGKGVLAKTGRYLEARVTMVGKDADKLPYVTSLTIRPETAAAGPAVGAPMPAMKVKLDIQTIVRSPIKFAYERADSPKIKKFGDSNKLAEVVKDGADDFEKLVLLMDWVTASPNERDRAKIPWKGAFPWDIEKVFKLNDDGTRVIYSHCGAYCQVFVTGATALGYHARHVGICGYKNKSHEVPEVWVPDLKRWIFFDPSLSTYYTDKVTEEPLNLMQMHRALTDTFMDEGMKWTMAKSFAGTFKKRMRAIGGNRCAKASKLPNGNPVGIRMGKHIYGKPLDPNYDWGTSHGIVCAGFLQITPRNDFNSKPPQPRGYGAYPTGANGNPFWVDEKTPVLRATKDWYSRVRDFYWTLDQATLQARHRAGHGGLEVEFGNSMPFFKAYKVTVDGAEVAGAANPFTWKLKKGANALTVAPVDEFGRVGIASSIEVEL